MTDETDERGAKSPSRPEDFIRLDLQTPRTWREIRSSFSLSIVVHALVLTALIIPWVWPWAWHAASVEREAGPIVVRFHVAGGTGPSGGGGGGGSLGTKPTAYVAGPKESAPAESNPTPRQAPVAPRRIPPLRAESLKVEDRPSDVSFAPYSPDAVNLPGLSTFDPNDYGGVDRHKSAGTVGGLGGGQGTGVGPGRGWGVGPGEGGGFGGGKYRPGGWDIEPVLKYKHPTGYPPRARERLIRGEVILEILVRTDGSTEVLRVLKSLPEGCVAAAVEAVKLYRWKPALKNGRPVEAVGSVYVSFNLIDRKG